MPAEPIPVVTENSVFAPEGVFFILTPVSVTTGAGIAGLKPGAAVTKLPNGRYLAPGGHGVELTANQVTNDIRVAELAFAADQAAQARMQAALAAAPGTPPPQPKTAAPPAAVASTSPAEPLKTDTPPPPSARPVPSGTEKSLPTPPKVTAAPATPAAKAAVAPPPVARTAPEGTFYLLEPTSVTTNDGVAGLSRGTELRKIEEGVYLAEGHRVELSASQVTNDILLAQQLRQTEAAQQAQIRQTLGANSEPVGIQSREPAPGGSANPRSTNPPSSSSSRNPLGGSTLQGKSLQKSSGLGTRH
ncbi:MAG TPA: hypothetical protein VF614_14755 [Chthoniobacteraceae bacterium]|jgi:hypothetical protein